VTSSVVDLPNDSTAVDPFDTARSHFMAREGASVPDQRQREPWVALIAITAVALVLRIIHLDSGPWIDEIAASDTGFRRSFLEILTTYPTDMRHPLYVVLASVMVKLFGDGAWSIRFPAMLFGAATVPALYFFARHLVSRREALLAAGLLAVSYHHVWFSQNARGYTMIAFFSIVSSTLLLNALRDRRRRDWLAFGVIAALGAFTHLTVIFTVVGQSLATAYVLLSGAPRTAEQRRAAWLNALVGFGTAAAVTVLLYLPMLDDVIRYFTQTTSQLRNVSTSSWALSEGVRVLRLGLGAGSGLGAVILLGGAIVVGAGGIDLLRRHTTAVLIMFVPALVTILGAMLGRGTMYPRFFFFLIGYVLIVVVHGAMVVGGWVSRLRPSLPVHAVGTALVGALVLASLASLPFNYRHPKQDYAGVLRFVERSRAADDTVVAIGWPSWYVFTQHYERPWRSAATARQLGRLRNRRIWLVYTFPRQIQMLSPDLWTVIQRDCTVRRVFPGTVGGGELVVCTMEPA
jgi:mannosyltransferase